MKNNYLCAVFFLLAGNLFCQDEITDIKTLIMANDPISNREITLLRKINMGIPGGDNWLVESTYPPPYGTNVLVYVINDGNITQKLTLGANYDLSEHTNFNIMKDIPGTRIGKGYSAIYDYNDDGFDEIFRYAFGGSSNIVWIAGYDPEKEKFVDYARIPFEIIDRDKGPAPAEFIIYKGMKGFKVYFFVYEVAGGPGWVPDPDPRNGKWIFYAWDEKRREFVEIEEVEEGGIESAWPAVVKKDIVEWVWKPNEQESDELQFAEKDQYEEVSELTADDSAKNKRVNFYIIAITCAIMLEVAIYIVRRRKR